MSREDLRGAELRGPEGDDGGPVGGNVGLEGVEEVKGGRQWGNEGSWGNLSKSRGSRWTWGVKGGPEWVEGDV